ncbi:solute carrier family 35 member F5 isoform X2 [Coccinella septempunctata]|uniref:solute carrier family 35 member F5 isoform X2 n=1 Tax=Coccinella septempunctata TaxID=41139 RepID=UPI001D08448F|nr:solute carrier family 35 member F5 isoform X2 [Coccinella septempunctata]
MEVNSIGQTKAHRFILGSILLILVDLFWVSSSELTKFIDMKETFQKPFFCTYVKNSMFTLYLLGFLFWPPWRETYSRPPVTYTYLEEETDEEIYSPELNRSLSNPVFVPIKTSDRDVRDYNSGTESDDSSVKSVRFSKLAEVRQMSESEAAEALLARLSYQASLRAGELAQRAAAKFTILKVASIAFLFCLLWFMGHYFFQLALTKTEIGMVNVLSSTSSLFTLFLASIFPSGAVDRMSLSKLFAVVLNIVGIAIISYTNMTLRSEITLGSILALFSALLHASCLVYLRKKVNNEEKMDIPLFFGFIGFFSLILLWPLFFFLHFSGLEKFELPSKEQTLFLLLNGLMGTVISEVVWLWGCFYTSSLIAIMSISLTIPMTTVADILLKKTQYSNLFMTGTIPAVSSFFIIIFFSHYENWDPVLNVLRCVYISVCRRTRFIRFSEMPSEQTESLIGINSNEHEA